MTDHETDALDAINEATTIARSILQTNNLLANLPRVLRHRPVVNEWNGGRVVVVGAGPSLEPEHVRELQSMQGRDTRVICTNTAAPALRDAGVRPDYLIAIESMDIPACDWPGPDAPAWILDLHCHPGWWERADERALWLSPHWTSCAPLTCELDVSPVHSGGAALTVAVQIGVQWGADVVLIGADLSYPAESGAACYAKGTAWENVSIAWGEEGYALKGQEERHKLHDSHGVSLETGGERRLVDAIGGGQVPTSVALLSQLRWLEKLPPAHGGELALSNATRSGARIAGWREEHVFDWCPGLRVGSLRKVTADRFRGCVTGLRKEAETMIEVAERMVDARRVGPGEVEGIARGCSIVESLVAPDLIKLHKRTDIPTPTRVEIVARAITLASESVIRRCTEMLEEM